jgi:hypothetical protein
MTPALAKKAHNETTIITSSEHFEFKTNNSYKKQVIKFQGGCYKPKQKTEDWKVHPMLRLVSLLYTYEFCLNDFL